MNFDDVCILLNICFTVCLPLPSTFPNACQPTMHPQTALSVVFKFEHSSGRHISATSCASFFHSHNPAYCWPSHPQRHRWGSTRAPRAMCNTERFAGHALAPLPHRRSLVQSGRAVGSSWASDTAHCPRSNQWLQHRSQTCPKFAFRMKKCMRLCVRVGGCVCECERKKDSWKPAASCSLALEHWTVTAISLHFQQYRAWCIVIVVITK